MPYLTRILVHWIELKSNHAGPFIIWGIYRQWSYKGDSTDGMQIKQVGELTRQIDEASAMYEKIIITGDVNLCSSKWSDVNYGRKNISTRYWNA